MFNWFKTDTEIKRDDYDKLHDKLNDALADHDKKVAEANSAYSSYSGSIPNLSNTKIPSNDFDPKREELNGKLMERFNTDKEKRASLNTAINQAYERYIYYKNLAIREEAAKEAKEAKERKERLERLYGKR